MARGSGDGDVEMEGDDGDKLEDNPSTTKGNAKPKHQALKKDDGSSSSSSKPEDDDMPKPKDLPLLFNDCGGLESQINYLRHAVLSSLNGRDGQYTRFGLEAPRGVLFYGPPGTGKTRLALALSGEISVAAGKHVHFIYRKGPDVQQMWFGESERILRGIFAEATKKKPAVIFFDELDAIAPRRDDAQIASQAYVSIVTTLLGLMDQVPRGEVFVIASTNRLDAIDPALRRPGRFDKQLEFQPPNEAGREQILRIHTSKWKVQPDATLFNKLAKGSTGFTGADLAKLCLDAFDRAMSLRIERMEGTSFQDMTFDDLVVTEEDWTEARRRMRPTSTSFEGSNLYVPADPTGAADPHVQDLVGRHMQQAGHMLESMLRHVTGTVSARGEGDGVNCGSSRINAMYIGFHQSSDGSAEENLIVCPMLQQPALANITKYVLDPTSLSTTRAYNLPSKINEVFAQALAQNGPCLIYLPHVDRLHKFLQGYRMGLSGNLNSQLEKLRGSPVILLGTGASDPSRFEPDHPFKAVFEMSSKSYDIDTGSEEEIRGFFQPFFQMGESSEVGLEDSDLCTFKSLEERVVAISKNQILKNIIQLYDNLHQILVCGKCGKETLTKHQLLESLWQTVASFESQIMGGRGQDELMQVDGNEE